MEWLIAMVLCGIDVLVRDDFAPLEGAKVALITNHTGRAADGRYTLDLLHEAPNLDLVALFAPEHGIRGELDEPVPEMKDEKTGLPIYSLYNPGAGDGRFRPTEAQLAGADTLVFDIQDIGTRFYTYVGTMGYAMEAAAEHNLRFVVLDRPNPIGGLVVEGPLADSDKLGLTAFHPIPLRHGMTAGELALLFKEERGIDVELEVIKCEGWSRDMWWDQTNLVWVNPSPNMRSLTQALLYPGIALIEASNVSVGRGTDTPFEIIGAPWIDGPALAAALNALGLPGFSCYAIEFTPDSSKFANQKCSGVAFIITDRSAFESVRTGCALAHVLHQMYPGPWEDDKLVRLMQNQAATDAVLRGGYEEAEPLWRPGLEAFREIRKRYLIY